ncbi:MAG: helix-turn-helix domain-containing protein [Bacillota bacterium]
MFGSAHTRNTIELMQKKLDMKAKLLKTEEEYKEACERIYSLINSKDNPIEPDSLEGEEIELLSLLVEKYERDNHPVDPPNSIEAIKFRMDQLNLKQVDIAPLFGGKTRVSEVMNGKRPLTLKMITLLNRYLGIPLESLVQGHKKIQLKKEETDKLSKNQAISGYWNTNLT